MTFSISRLIWNELDVDNASERGIVNKFEILCHSASSTSKQRNGNSRLDRLSQSTQKPEPMSAEEKATSYGIPSSSILSQPTDCRKNVLDRLRYKFVTRQVSIPISAISVPSATGGRQVMMIVPALDKKRLLAKFKSGRMTHDSDTNMVTAKRDKGEVSLWMVTDHIFMLIICIYSIYIIVHMN